MREKLEQTLETLVGGLLEEAGDGETPPGFALEVPKREEHGDFACNAAMLLTKRLRKAPREIAERLVEGLGSYPDFVERAEVAGPGFVNKAIAGTRRSALC